MGGEGHGKGKGEGRGRAAEGRRGEREGLPPLEWRSGYGPDVNTSGLK